jgi:hypothetical protein
MTPSLFEQRRNHNLLKSFKLFFGQALTDIAGARVVFAPATMRQFDRDNCSKPNDLHYYFLPGELGARRYDSIIFGWA